MAINPIQVEKFLKGIDYPASKDDLVKKAEQNGADEEIRSTLQQLKEDKFGSPADVSKAIGEFNHKK